MKFSFEWLKKFVRTDLSPEQIAAKITEAGLEVEAIENGVVDLSVPPNRADCLGVIGIAREVAAITSTKFTEPDIKSVAAKIQDKISLSVQDAAACPRYLSRIIKGVDNSKPTPDWIKQCLIDADMSLISPVVDITNYVLLEWGQPLHAFDLKKIQEGIVVRKARDGEELLLLDESKVKLTAQTLIIADKKHALAIAGVKGGMDSGISTETQDIMIECAYFDPITVRLASRQYGLKTDGAYRFERCIDPDMQEKVMQHVTQLILDTVGGQPGPITEFVSQDHLPKTVVLSLRQSRIAKILGIKIDTSAIIKILQNLGFNVENHNSDDELMVTVPSFRPDVTREIDLIEEIARVYGLDQIPAQVTKGALEFQPIPEAKLTESQILTCMANRGYHETINYSFIDLEYAKMFSLDINDKLCLANPISSEMGFMRQSLLPGLVKLIQYNQNRQQERVRLFEVGLRFQYADQQLQQRKTLAGVCYGYQLPESWGADKRLVDIFDVKADVLALLQLAHITDLEFHPTTDKAMHPKQCFDVVLHGNVIGRLGSLHPQIQQELSIPNTVVMFELDYAAVANGAISNFKDFSKFPAVRRDIAVLIGRDLEYSKIEQVIRRQVADVLVATNVFDVYQGKGIPTDKKSIAISIILQHQDRTLTDAEVLGIYNGVIAVLKAEFGAELR